MKLLRPKGINKSQKSDKAKEFKIKNKRLLQKRDKHITKKETVGGSYFDLHREEYK